MNKHVADYFRCSIQDINLDLTGPLSPESGYFRFGEQGMYYGQLCGGKPVSAPDGPLSDMTAAVKADGGVAYLPFNLGQVVDNLRHELYVNGTSRGSLSVDSFLRDVYYRVRPLLPASLRQYLQKTKLSDWKRIPFPRWPVDCSVDQLFGQVLLAALRAKGLDRTPFIWFWPEGSPGCAIMTHDVDSQVGYDYCSEVMDIEESYGVRSCFAVVPEQRYEVAEAYLDTVRGRGFEIAIHDLNHDGQLFRDRKEFLARAKKINAYGKQFGVKGFRSAVLYRNQSWFDALDFSYDMSVPNIGHLEAQRGGCCTVMPYFVGDILELPTTTTQDYALFTYLNEYSIDHWKKQFALILAQHGLINLIVHPDYIASSLENSVFRSLLDHLVYLREHKGLWVTTPGMVDRWWRQRAKMSLVEDDKGQMRIEGEGSEVARIAYASEDDGRVRFSFLK